MVHINTSFLLELFVMLSSFLTRQPVFSGEQIKVDSKMVPDVLDEKY